MNLPNDKVRKKQRANSTKVADECMRYLNSFATSDVVHNERVETALRNSTSHPSLGAVDHIAEFFSPPRVCLVARTCGLRAETSEDLLSGYDLLDMGAQTRVLQDLLRRRAQVVSSHKPKS